jgi:hypothetical protein
MVASPRDQRHERAFRATSGYLLTVVTIKGLARFWSRCPAGSLYLRLPARHSSVGVALTWSASRRAPLGEGWLQKGLLRSR